MKRARRQPSDPSPSGDDHPAGRAAPGARTRELADLRSRLAEAEETLRAIRTGEVDAVVIDGKTGLQVFTLEGAEHAYRELIESMNEGALTVTADKTILYANQCFARMVKCPLEKVTGSSFRRFLSDTDRATLRQLVMPAAKAGSKIQVHLLACDGSQLPVQISLSSLVRKGSNLASIGMVVTDMTAAKRTEDLLRKLTHRVVQVQEAERRSLALELHNRITQLLCATLFRSQTLANQLSAHDGALKQEAIALRDMLGQAAEEVERISHGLRPGVLNELGLAAVLRSTTREFAERTGVSVKLTCVPLSERMPADTELALYRILQEALKNVEQHARARHVKVQLTKPDAIVKLLISDDGTGFDAERQPTQPEGKGGLGLVSMRERAVFSGGTFKVKSTRRAGLAEAGTAIEVRIPIGKPPSAGSGD